LHLVTLHLVVSDVGVLMVSYKNNCDFPENFLYSSDIITFSTHL